MTMELVAERPPASALAGEVVALAGRGEQLLLALRGLSRAHQANLLTASASFQMDDVRYKPRVTSLDEQASATNSYHLADSKAAFITAYGSGNGAEEAWQEFASDYGAPNLAQNYAYTGQLSPPIRRP